MNSATSSNQLQPAQHAAAKVVGFLYLFTMATSIFGFAVRGPLIVPGDALQTVTNITASERLFRISIASDLLTVVGVIILVLALYVVLKPINRNIALLATFWRLAENFTLAVITLNGFAMVALVRGTDSVQAFDANQLSTLVSALYRVWGAGFNIGFVFLGLGSTVFSYLWLKSGYIPRPLAILGIVASLLLGLINLASMVFPPLANTLGMICMMPMFFYEVGLGLWLLVKGLEEPRPNG